MQKLHSHFSKQLLFFLVGFLFLLPIQLLAFDRGPCHADREKFCSSIQPGEGQVIHCMNEHLEELSQECRVFIQKRQEQGEEGKHPHKNQAWRESCQGDHEKYCSDPSLKGEIFPCLQSHLSELSPECREKIGTKK